MALFDTYFRFFSLTMTPFSDVFDAFLGPILLPNKEATPMKIDPSTRKTLPERQEKIDPSTLKSLRERQGWSQADLARKSSVSKRQIQRLEDPQTGSADTQVRRTTASRLARALGVSPERLSGARPSPALPTGRSKGLEEALSQRLNSRTLLNFDLLTAKYGVTMEEVIWVAPALFSIFAERAARLHRERVVKLIPEGHPDIELDEVSPQPGEVQSTTNPETSVIRRTKIFWPDEDGMDWDGGDNAFIEALREALAETQIPPEQFFDVIVENGPVDMYPGYRIPRTSILQDELDRVTCLDPDAHCALVWGGARLPEIPHELLQAHRAIERIQWLRARSWTAKTSEGDET
jgi:transcriptional regulator with XRE-family HTH domain